MSQNISRNQTFGKRTKIVRKVKRFKIQVIIDILCAINDRFCSIGHDIYTALLTQ
jgi:hypothetical protein